MKCETCKRIDICPMASGHINKVEKVKSYIDFLFGQDIYTSAEDVAKVLGVESQNLDLGDVLTISCNLHINIEDCRFFSSLKKCPHCGVTLQEDQICLE